MTESAEEYWLKKHPNQLKPHLTETEAVYHQRLQWKENGFCNYQELAKKLGKSVKTIQHSSHKYAWAVIRNNYEMLLDQEHFKVREKDIKVMEDDYSSIWATARNSIKYRLQDLTNKIQDELDESVLSELWNEYYNTIKQLKSIQSSERVNMHLPNVYKDTNVKVKADVQIEDLLSKIKTNKANNKDLNDFLKNV